MKSAFLITICFSSIFGLSENTGISNFSIPSEINELTENQISNLTEEELLAKYDVPKEESGEKKNPIRSRKISIDQFKRPESNLRNTSKLQQQEIFSDPSLPPNVVQGLPDGIKSLLSSNISIEIKQEIISNIKAKIKSKETSEVMENKHRFGHKSLRQRFPPRNRAATEDLMSPQPTRGEEKLDPEANRNTRDPKEEGRKTRQKISPADFRNRKIKGLDPRRGRKATMDKSESVTIDDESEDTAKKRRTQTKGESMPHRERSVINPFKSKVDSFNKTKKARGPLYRIKPRYGEPDVVSRNTIVDEEENQSITPDPTVDLLENPTELETYVYFGNSQRPQAHRRKAYPSTRKTRRTRGSILNKDKTGLENKQEKKETAANDMTSLHFPSRYRKRSKVM